MLSNWIQNIPTLKPFPTDCEFFINVGQYSNSLVDLRQETMKSAQLVTTAAILQLAIGTPVSYYKPLTEEEEDRLAAWTPESEQPMWQLSGQYEGDMLLTPNQFNGVLNKRLRWPKGEIPYQLSNDFTAEQKQQIVKSLEVEFSKTCVKPRPRKWYELNYVYVTGKNSGCYSYVGRIGGRQQLNLDVTGCVHHGVITHEFLHAAGFQHQHGATDRDNYVTIIWKNIIRGYEYAFDKFGPLAITSFGQKYDYDSIMHYTRTAFSSNGQPTIIPKDPIANIGQSDGMSRIDIIKLNKMYNCR